MATIPQTNVSMTKISDEYGGGTPDRMSEYYRAENNNNLVKDHQITPYDPKYWFYTSYTPSSAGVGGNVNYARRITIIRYNGGGYGYDYVADTDIDYEWFYNVKIGGYTTQNTSGTNPGFGGPYGSTTSYFYFCPDGNIPFPSGKTIQDMFIKNDKLEFTFGGVPFALWQNYYALWKTLGRAQFITDYNQTVPTSGKIRLSDFRGRRNP